MHELKTSLMKIGKNIDTSIDEVTTLISELDNIKVSDGSYGGEPEQLLIDVSGCSDNSTLQYVSDQFDGMSEGTSKRRSMGALESITKKAVARTLRMIESKEQSKDYSMEEFIKSLLAVDQLERVVRQEFLAIVAPEPSVLGHIKLSEKQDSMYIEALYSKDGVPYIVSHNSNIIHQIRLTLEEMDTVISEGIVISDRLSIKVVGHEFSISRLD